MILEHRFAHIPQDARRGRAWIASLAPLFTASLAPDEAVPIDAFLRYQHLGSCVLAADKGPAQVLQRTPEQARVQALDHLVLWTPLHGRARRVDGDQVDSVGPGEILVLDLSHPVQIEMEALAARALLVPHRLVDDGREPPDRYGGIDLRRDRHLDALVAGHLCRLGDCLPDLTATQVQTVASATLTLCRVLLQGQTSGSASGLPGKRDDLGLEVRRYIESNLATVDASTLMSRFGLSRTLEQAVQIAPILAEIRASRLPDRGGAGPSGTTAPSRDPVARRGDAASGMIPDVTHDRPGRSLSDQRP